ncbi:MAG: ABC transporter permease [Eubacteriaceae bacterium]|nr:ABC transporter permease [Eubacteriaceae bacterium]
MEGKSGKRSFSGFIEELSGASFVASIASILVGLLVGYLVLLSTNPSNAAQAFKALLRSGIADRRSMGQVLYFATPVMMTGLSVSFGNKTGLFNIGASGQFIVGAYVAILVGVRLTAVPGQFRWVIALLMAMFAGGIWGALPGVLKSLRNVNEVISCIMMNYIGMYTVNFLITKTVFDPLKNQSLRVPTEANVPKMGMDLVFRVGNQTSSANGGIFIAVGVAVLAHIILERTKFGFELKACGFNKDAAKYAGINERKCIVASMAIAGAMSGLGGALLYLAGSGKGIDVIDVMAQEGFNGIPVALLALNNPIGAVFSSLFISYLNVGGFNMQLYNFAPQVIEIIISIIIYFSAFSLVLKTWIRNLVSKKNKSRVVE